MQIKKQVTTMAKKIYKGNPLSRRSMEHRFDYLLKSVLHEIENQELSKHSPEYSNLELTSKRNKSM